MPDLGVHGVELGGKPVQGLVNQGLDQVQGEIRRDPLPGSANADIIGWESRWLRIGWIPPRFVVACFRTRVVHCLLAWYRTVFHAQSMPAGQ